jgi:lipoprotein-anchoring transpeptidase ErfK/SrfK
MSMKKLMIIVVFVCFLTASFVTRPMFADSIDVCGQSAVSIHLDSQEILRVKKLVKTGYRGNYTLNWAKEHDYKESDKVKWVNINRYESQTHYLVWVSIAYQRLNVFTGSAGNWNLDRSFIVATGKSGRDTPVGVWRLLAKKSGGWTTAAYTVKPVVNFINEKYGFHSRLYYPDSTTVYDSRIGFPCSHGCIRMYTTDVDWFYKNVPINTTVVVY